MSGSFVLFDLGGTKLRIAVSHDGETLGEPKVVPTPANFNEGVETIERLGKEMLGGAVPAAVAGGIGWVLDTTRSHIFRSTKANFLDWNDKPLREELERRFGVSAYLENDCVLAAVGEAGVGTGKGYDIVAYYTVSTGVGGARVALGKPDAYAVGFEPGKQLIDGVHLEQLVSGAAVEKKYGISPKDLADVGERTKLGQTLARGVHNSIVHWSPHIVVFGGSMITGVNPIPLDVVEETLKTTLTFLPSLPKIAMAALGDFGILEGARIVAQSK